MTMVSTMSERNAKEKPFADKVDITSADWRHAADWVKENKAIVEDQNKFYVQSTSNNESVKNFTKEVKKYNKRAWTDFNRYVHI